MSDKFLFHIRMLLFDSRSILNKDCRVLFSVPWLLILTIDFSSPFIWHLLIYYMSIYGNLVIGSVLAVGVVTDRIRQSRGRWGMSNMNGHNRPRMCVFSSAEFLDRQREPLTSLERRKQRIFAKVEVQGPPRSEAIVFYCCIAGSQDVELSKCIY